VTGVAEQRQADVHGHVGSLAVGADATSPEPMQQQIRYPAFLRGREKAPATGAASASSGTSSANRSM
jgi:hypothetical protein